MYTSFSIENFRLFDRLTVEPLARVNLIAGQNNAGKTALLEALWLHSGPNLPDLGVRLSRFRGIAGTDPNRLLNDLFGDFDTKREIHLSARGAWGNKPRKLVIRSQPQDISFVAAIRDGDPTTPPRGSQETDVSTVSSTQIILDYTDEEEKTFISSGWWTRLQSPSLASGLNLLPVAMAAERMEMHQAEMSARPSAVFLGSRHRTGPDEDVVRFGEVELAGYSEEIVNCLRQVDPRIKRLTTIAAPPNPMIYADVGLTRPVPVGFLGDGIGRLLSMALAFYQSRNGIVLIDEIENGLHHSVLMDVWKKLDWLSREFKVQVFATTHSYECMVAAHHAFTELGSEELHLHRLYRRNASEPVRAMTYSKEALDTNIEFFWELR